MKEYYSNYLVTEYDFYPVPPYKGKGWIISFEDKPEYEYTFSHTKTYINNKLYPPKAVMIHAVSPERAQDVIDLIYASLCLVLGELPGFDKTFLVPIASDPDERRDEEDGHPRYIETGYIEIDRLPLACMVAAKASHRRYHQYALFKYLLSHESFSTRIMDLDPSHWRPTKFVFVSAEHHVRCANSIVLAYSVLEELSLELRVSPENPSKVNGKWNPIVKNELEARLKKAGIDLSETLLWTLRDTPTRIEGVRSPPNQSKAPWAKWKIRDSEVAVIDAIAYASWLRSKISAHRLRELAGSLNYYDVSNVQHLARRLLLEKPIW